MLIFVNICKYVYMYIYIYINDHIPSLIKHLGVQSEQSPHADVTLNFQFGLFGVFTAKGRGLSIGSFWDQFQKLRQ